MVMPIFDRIAQSDIEILGVITSVVVVTLVELNFFRLSPPDSFLGELLFSAIVSSLYHAVVKES